MNHSISPVVNSNHTLTKLRPVQKLYSNHPGASKKRRIIDINVRVSRVVKEHNDARLPLKAKGSVQQTVRLRDPQKPSFTDYERSLTILSTARKRNLVGNFPSDKRFLLYRAIGNDLPPRHSIGQVYANVRFIVDHEPRYPDLDRRWYINRIVNESELARILDLLVSRNETFVIDHFNTSTYSYIDFNFDAFEHPDVLRGPLFSKRSSKTARRLATDLVFKAKNQYIVHNNQARNAMIDLGIQSGATYVLPWDGNCFLTPNAWHNITSAVESVLHTAILLNSSASESTLPSVSRTSLRYFYVPMQRMIKSNDFLLNSSYVPSEVSEEPQLIFHRDATERFNESLPYGCGPKVDLLYRLRIPGIWTAKAADPNSCFGAANRSVSLDVPGNDSVSIVGWTARLFSGVRHLEMSGATRGFSRTIGFERISAFATLSTARHTKGFMPDAPLMYSIDSIKNFAMYYNQHHADSAPGLIQSLLNETRNELATDMSRRTFTSAAHDAAIHALTAIVASVPASLHRSRQLVLACIARDTTPDVRHSGAVCSMLDTARLLWLSDGFTSEDRELTRRWVYRRLDSLSRTKAAKAAYYETDADGVHFELMTACLAAYHGDFPRVVRATGLAKSRLHVQIGTRSLWRNGFDDAVDGLIAWAMLAEIAERIGEDIWSFGSDPVYGGTALLPTAILSVVVERFAQPLTDQQAIRTRRAVHALACLTTRAAARSSAFRWPDDHALPDRECSQNSVAFVGGRIALPPLWNLEWMQVGKGED